MKVKNELNCAAGRCKTWFYLFILLFNSLLQFGALNASDGCLVTIKFYILLVLLQPPKDKHAFYKYVEGLEIDLPYE